MNKLARNIPIYALGNILPQIVSFLLLPIYTRYLLPDQYGIVNSMQLIQTLLIVFFSLCLDRSIFRLYWDYKTEGERRNYLGTVVITIVVFAFILLSFLFIFKGYVGRIYKSIEFYPYYVYAILYAFFSVFTLVPMAYFMVKQQASRHFALSVGRFISETCLVLWFVVVKNEGAVGLLKGKLIGIAIMVPIFIYILYKIIRFKFDFQIFRSSMSYSLPIIPGIIGAWVLDLSDRIFIERYFSLADVGIYSLGYKIASLVGILLGAFFMAYTPFFFEVANSDNKQYAKATLYKYNHIAIIITLISGFIIAFFAREAITIVLDKKYHDAYHYVPIIVLVYIFSQIGGVVGLSFKQSKKMKQEMFITVGLALVNIILNFILVPPYSAYGAAYATLISFFLCLVISYIYSKQKCYFIPFNWKQILPISGILTATVLFYQYGINLNIYMSLIIKSITVITVLLFFGMKYYSQIRTIFLKY